MKGESGMLLKITNKCTMGCNHCISDCKPDGIDMDIETFNQALKFLKSYRHTTINITGGEPMEHPNFWDIYMRIVNTFTTSVIIVTTNGEWIDNNIDEFSNKYQKAAGPFRYWQITRDRKYYPRQLSKGFIDKVKGICGDKIFIQEHIRYIYPKGRAYENKIPYNMQGPLCFNIRSISNNVDNFYQLIGLLALNKKHCTPSIEPDGSINLGESGLCPQCSNIWKSDKEILEDIRNFKCIGCSELIDVATKKYGPQILSVMK